MISFIVCYQTGKMFNCTSSISLADNHRVRLCYVEPCSGLICLLIHPHIVLRGTILEPYGFYYSSL